MVKIVAKGGGNPPLFAIIFYLLDGSPGIAVLTFSKRPYGFSAG